MSTDKTLADVQPGGRVRLGDQVAEYQYRFWNDEMPGWSSWQPISKSDYERELVEPLEGREVRALYASPSRSVELKMARDSIQALLSWIDDWAETPEECGLDPIAERALEVVAQIDAQVYAHAPNTNPPQPSTGGQGQLDVNDLAQAIRKVDGRHLLGAGALAEAILSELPHLAVRQPVGEPLAVSRMVSTAPEKIFLQIGDGDYSDEPFPHPVGEEITWCSDSIVESEVAYVRADLAAPRAHTVDLSRFRSLARWVANSAGHGINSGQRRMGEELLALIDGKAAQ